MGSIDYPTIGGLAFKIGVPCSKVLDAIKELWDQGELASIIAEEDGKFAADEGDDLDPEDVPTICKYLGFQTLLEGSNED